MTLITVCLVIAVGLIIGGLLLANNFVLAVGVGMLIGSAAALLDWRTRP